MEGFRSFPNYAGRKLDADFNLDYVEVDFIYQNFQFCTDTCVKGKYEDFKLKKEQKDCLVNCYTKINKLNSFVASGHNLFVNKTE